MCKHEHRQSSRSITARGLASRLLIILVQVGSVVDDGGQVTETHVNSLLRGAADLLHELGGFEAVLARLYTPPSGPEGGCASYANSVGRIYQDNERRPSPEQGQMACNYAFWLLASLCAIIESCEQRGDDPVHYRLLRRFTVKLLRETGGFESVIVECGSPVD